MPETSFLQESLIWSQELPGSRCVMGAIGIHYPPGQPGRGYLFVYKKAPVNQTGAIIKNQAA